jgi:hypothetical protein
VLVEISGPPQSYFYSHAHTSLPKYSWVRGKCEETMREVLGAGRGVQAGEVEIPAMAAEARRETRQGAESDEESDGCDGAQDCNTTYFTKPQGFIIRPPLLTTNKVFWYLNRAMRRL